MNKSGAGKGGFGDAGFKPCKGKDKRGAGKGGFGDTGMGGKPAKGKAGTYNK